MRRIATLIAALAVAGCAHPAVDKTSPAYLAAQAACGAEYRNALRQGAPESVSAEVILQCYEAHGIVVR